MKNAIVIILLVAGIFLTYQGISTIQSATADVEILGIDISASDEGGQTAGILYLLLGIAAVIGSFFTWKKG